MELTDQQIELLSDAAMLVGFVDSQGRPDCFRCFGATTSDHGRTLRLLVPRPWGALVAADLRDGARLAFIFTRVTTYESFQAKGHLIGVEDATDTDRGVAARYFERFAEAAVSINLDESTRDYVHDPELAITFQTEHVFRQTPGPGAGERLGQP